MFTSFNVKLYLVLKVFQWVNGEFNGLLELLKLFRLFLNNYNSIFSLMCLKIMPYIIVLITKKNLTNYFNNNDCILHLYSVSHKYYSYYYHVNLWNCTLYSCWNTKMTLSAMVLDTRKNVPTAAAKKTYLGQCMVIYKYNFFSFVSFPII